MKKISALISMLMLCIAAGAQTLNVQVGSVTYQFPSSQTGDMTFADGTSLTIMEKTFAIDEITAMTVDNTSVTDNTVKVNYNGSTASVVISGNVAKYLTPQVTGAHVSIAQSADLAQEITYTLSGSSTDGEFYMSGSYKATVELNGLNLTNDNLVFSGAAVHIQNGKRIKVKVVNGTTNTLSDAADGSQKGCLYIKGHAEFAQKGTLNVVGNVKHAIKAGEYISLKNATINVTSAVGDGISCNQYFLMESGTINISGTADDGIQVDLDGTESTGVTTDHEDEDTGNVYISGGTVNVTCDAIAAKGIKCVGDISITGGTIIAKTTGDGTWDIDDLETKAACGIAADGNITIDGGNITLTATGSGGKGMKCDGVLTINNGTITATTSGGLYYNNGTTENLNYTGDTDRVDSKYYSSPKAIKAGLKTQNGSTYTYTGSLVINGGTITVTTGANNGEGIESKNTLIINGGIVIADCYDDAINAGQDLTINDGYVYARASNNDAIDANGNCYIKGGLIYAIGASGVEKSIDANTEGGKKLYFSGGTLVAIGDLESGSSLTQTCYSTNSWTANTWYAMTYGGNTFAFKTPASGGRKLIVSAASTPTLKKSVTVSAGTEMFDGKAYTDATCTGGSSVSLSNYTPSGGGGPGH